MPTHDEDFARFLTEMDPDRLVRALEKITVQPTDVVLFTVPDDVSQEQMFRLGEIARRVFEPRGAGVLVKPESVSVQVVDASLVAE